MIRFRLNGREVESGWAGETPLLWVVRDEFRLKGSKFGCGAGLCGACTMHIDGQAARTCILPLSAAAGKSVTTIEGLAPPGGLHPLQAAWVEKSVPQCGYCQSGQIMSAAALLEAKPGAGADDVDAAMAGNLCRCGCYPRIKDAILAVAGNRAHYARLAAELAVEATAAAEANATATETEEAAQ